MVGGADAHEPLGAERIARKGALVEESFHEGAVDGALGEQGQKLLGAPRTHRGPNLGMRGQIAHEGDGHYVFSGGEGHADAQLDGCAVGHFGDALVEQRVVVGHGGKGVAQHTARSGELQLLAVVGKQLRVVFPLEIRDVLRHGRLRESQLLGGAGVVERLADGEEGLHAKVLHRASFLEVESRGRGGARPHDAW